MNNNSMCSSSNNNKLHQRDHGNTKQASPDSQKNPAYDVEDTRRQAAINALKAMVQDGAMANASGFQVNAYGVPSWIISIRITFELWNGMVGPFQPVMNQNNEYVNVIMVRAPYRGKDDEELYTFYKDDILFLGISSFESFPLKSPNPYSSKYESDYYLDMFEGFLHNMHDPEVHFPSSVKTILMSQSDFMLDEPIRYGKRHKNVEKVYDFVYSGGDQDVESDCVGWASYNKNFSFVREALEVMCSSEFNVTGVLVANKNKAGTKSCTIPKSCDGKMVQTTFLDQSTFFDYLSKARWAFLPQVCDASPRVSTQALSMDVPLLMNQNIMGGWKYLLPGESGEFFHDMSNFKESLRRILDNTRGETSPYRPLDFVTKNYGNEKSGERLLQFVKENWGDRVDLPEGTTRLIPTGA
ncbi:predicted protein [Thalassiosira pseudonana CCMP1335]|uniref:Exostosin GT47 domain-containing protein n=1 Tax=Thalassiosira pseudonana TaxID=35128 RepID=B8BXZ0_THAPS|nr:predicted protein [Thalassiosira pseudonana CCMP1335]EED93794.1 predicted protein [Thalassiosira pseudonana CCMP1335]